LAIYFNQEAVYAGKEGAKKINKMWFRTSLRRSAWILVLLEKFSRDQDMGDDIFD